MPVVQVPCTAADGVLAASAGSWAAGGTGACQVSSANDNVDYTTTQPFFQAYYSGVTFWCSRGFLPFDTNGYVPASATITGAVIYLYCSYIDAASNACVVPASNTSMTTLAAADFSRITRTELTASRVPTPTLNSWAAITLNAAGIANITPGGVGKFALIDNRDFDQSFPGTTFGTPQTYGWRWKASNYTTDSTKQPYLEVTYTAPAGGVFRRRQSGLYVKR